MRLSYQGNEPNEVFTTVALVGEGVLTRCGFTICKGCRRSISH